MSGKWSKDYWEFGTNAKPSGVSVHIVTQTAGNIVAQAALLQDLEDAIDAVTLGNNGTEQTVATITPVVRNPSLNPIAQRENKWLVQMEDTVSGLPASFTIPCYDPSLLGPDGESMDTTSAEYAALVAAVEAVVRSAAGNVVSVVGVVFRTRTK